MSDASTHLGLPYLLPAQAQKHVTHNESLRLLDLVTQLSVKSADLAAPPGTSAEGDRYLVAAGALAPWLGQEERIACYLDGGWSFLLPQAGWTAWVEDQAELRVFDGAAWVVPASSLPQTMPMIGVNATADTTNRLTVSAPATLLNNAGAGHQLKINKAAQSDTASLLFQSNWSGRAEMGLAGDNDFRIKVSANGSAFSEAMKIDAATAKVSFPAGLSGLAPAAFGAGSLVTTGYVTSKGSDLVTNGTGLLGNNYNFPANFAYDSTVTPALPASFSCAGYYPGAVEMTEFLPVDPNQVYRLMSYVHQESTPGNWSGYATGERHMQYMGLNCYDADLLPILVQHHARYRHSGTDSRTTLAAPMKPGDTTVTLTNSAGWNESASATFSRGLIVFGYRNAAGYLYNDYSRLIEPDMFDLGGVNKTTHVVTLKKPVPASLGNPADGQGIWPAGTPIANSHSGSAYKYSFFGGLVPSQTNTWYRSTSFIGGIDRSGGNVTNNFTPGTAFTKVFWLPNFSNRSGGYSTYADTGAGHKVRFAGVSVMPFLVGDLVAVTSGSVSGSFTVRAPLANPGTGALSMAAATATVVAV